MAATSPDTIVALSSGRLPAGVAIVRLSGPSCRTVLETIAGFVPPPRQATVAVLRGRQRDEIDKGLVLFFAGPKSFTGEDCAELHLHGSRAIVAAVLAELTDMPAVRLAEAGEFTRRAFLNGKIDLLQAEGLADLVAADTEAQRRLALHNSEGAQSLLYARWREQILHARAMIEAELDFADESDVPGSVSEAVWLEMSSLASAIQVHIQGYRQAEIIRDGFEVVIIGPPNAGKSSLINALARREVAIVSDEPGTTRDMVEAVLDLDGVKVRLTDTAGIRSDAGGIEAIGIARAKARAQRADLVLNLSEQGSGWLDGPQGIGALRVATKIDLAPSHPADLAISVASGQGLQELLEEISSLAARAAGDAGDVIPSRERHVQYLKSCLDHLLQACTSIDGLEIRAEELRLASDHLGRISGKVDPEHLLGVIFSQFCIGK